MTSVRSAVRNVFNRWPIMMIVELPASCPMASCFACIEETKNNVFPYAAREQVHILTGKSESFSPRPSLCK